MAADALRGHDVVLIGGLWASVGLLAKTRFS